MVLLSRDEALIIDICEKIKEAKSASQIKSSSCWRNICDIDLLYSEVNSGASFEQYFRWASASQIKRVITALNEVGLTEIAIITKEAVEIAFPNGVPDSDEKKSSLTYNWSLEQEDKLANLYKPFFAENSSIITTLAIYVRECLSIEPLD